MPPQGSDLVLATDIPDVELDVLVCDGLDVEADGGNGGDVLAELELVEDGGFAGGVETQHQQAHLLGSEDLAHHFAKLATHFGEKLFGSFFSSGVACASFAFIDVSSPPGSELEAFWRLVFRGAAPWSGRFRVVVGGSGEKEVAGGCEGCQKGTAHAQQNPTFASSFGGRQAQEHGTDRTGQDRMKTSFGQVEEKEGGKGTSRKLVLSAENSLSRLYSWTGSG